MEWVHFKDQPPHWWRSHVDHKDYPERQPIGYTFQPVSYKIRLVAIHNGEARERSRAFLYIDYEEQKRACVVLLPVLKSAPLRQIV